MGAETAHVHLPQVDARLTFRDPLGHHLADPAGSRQAVGAEAGRHEQPADLGLAEAELVVGREALGPVDHAGHADLLHHRHPPAGVLDDLLESVPVLLEQAAVEVGRDRVQAARSVEEGRRAVALVAAHDQPAALLAEIDQQVGIPQGRQRVVGIALAERLGDEVLVRHRHHRHPDAGHAPDLGRRTSRRR